MSEPLLFDLPLHARNSNPCVRAYGAGLGATCGECQMLLVFDYHNRTYFKCELRTLTHGAATDHRKRWRACGRFVREGKA